MARPKILSETKREQVEKRPPEGSVISPHRWLSPESVHIYERTVRDGRAFDVYLSSTAAGKIENHAAKEAPKGLEVMGFMLGEVFLWEKAEYAVVRDVVTTGLRSSPSKVKFDPAALPKLFGRLDDSEFDYVIVGWYHSHPGHTCFLSRTDLQTQRTMFSQSYHSALVIDPLNEAIKCFKLTGDGYSEVPFAVVREPLRAKRSKRTRRLRTDPAVKV